MGKALQNRARPAQRCGSQSKMGHPVAGTLLVYTAPQICVTPGALKSTHRSILALRRDRLALWLCTIGLPFALTAPFHGVAALF